MSHLRVVNPISLEDLKKFPLIYLASPYTLYPSGREQAFREVKRLTATLLLAGMHAYSPVVYGHILEEVDPLNEELWNAFNDVQLEKCDAVMVARMVGWQSSKGVTREIKFAEERKRPLYFIHPETLEVY
jgi:nucleoside 2-deoxyribosyltransferase